MKVATFGLDIQSGKHKYNCECFEKLVKKFSPKKETPYTVEFIGEDFAKSDAVVFDINKKLDFILLDLEKIENRLSNMEDGKEKDLWKQAQELLEKETLLCDHNFNEEEKAILRNLSLATFKPSLARGEVGDLDGLIKELMQKAGIMLFFTVCEKEARAWELRKGSTILEAAGKIHTDLAKGFIKADVVCCKDLDSFFNMAEARAKGFVRVVDKDYIMEEGNIIEIRFSI